MKNIIQDEFADLPISKQRKWQLRKAKAGLCMICGATKVTAFHCLKHAIAQREREHKKLGCKKRIKSLTYRLQEGAAQ